MILDSVASRIAPFARYGLSKDNLLNLYRESVYDYGKDVVCGYLEEYTDPTPLSSPDYEVNMRQMSSSLGLPRRPSGACHPNMFYSKHLYRNYNTLYCSIMGNGLGRGNI